MRDFVAIHYNSYIIVHTLTTCCVHTNHLRVDPALVSNGEDIEASEDECMVPVQWIRVLGRVLFPLPCTEVGQEMVNVMGPLKFCWVLVQDLQTLQHKFNFVAKGCIVVQKLHL